jgi:hypothetical protein
MNEWRDADGLTFKNFIICIMLQKQVSSSLKFVRLIDEKKNNYEHTEGYLKTINKRWFKYDRD